MANSKVIKYSELLTDLTARGSNAKSAAAKKAAENPKSVPEKDPNDKGGVAVPKDPDGTPAKTVGLENKTNEDGTPVWAAPGARVIDGPEKAAHAKLTKKAENILTSIQALRKSAGGTASEISTNGSLPSDAGNEQPKPAGPTRQPNGGKADPAVKGAGKDKMPMDGAEKRAPTPEGDSKGELPKEEENANKAATADVDLANIDHTFFSKLAQTCLQFEEGRNIMEACLKKAHGAEHATNLIKTAMFMESKLEELAQLEDAGASAAEQFWKSASEDERAGLVKLASAHDQALRSFGTEVECQAYLEGAKIAADMADAGMTADQPPPGVPGMGGEGDPAAAQGAGGGEVSDDDIIQALQMLVQEGKLTEEDAEAILQQLLGGQGGPGGEADAGAAGGSPAGAPADAAAGAAPGGGAPPEPEPSPDDKAAGAQFKTVGQAVDAVFASLKAA